MRYGGEQGNAVGKFPICPRRKSVGQRNEKIIYMPPQKITKESVQKMQKNPYKKFCPGEKQCGTIRQD